MDSSSDDEGVITHRKSTSKRIFDSDDEDGAETHGVQAEATDDFKLHLSDEEGESSMHLEAFSEANSDGKEVNNDSDSDGGMSDKSSTKLSPDRTVLKESNLKGSSSPTDSKINEYPKQVSYAGHDDIMKKLSALADSDSESDVDGDLEQQPNKGSKRSEQGHDSSSDSDSGSVSSEKNLKSLGKDCRDAGKSSKSKMKERASSVRKSKTKAKDAMLEIKTESQRQLRQSSINLPYHVPKQRSLLDFLNRRRSVPSMPIKGPPEQLAEVWREIEAREKEVEEFYKSESEADSDDDTEKLDLPNLEEGESSAIELQKHTSGDNETVLETEPKQSDENDVEPDTPLSLNKINDNPDLELEKTDLEKTSEECTDEKTNLSPQSVPSAEIELGTSSTSEDGKIEEPNPTGQSSSKLVPSSTSASAQSTSTSYSGTVLETPFPLLNENSVLKRNSKCDDNYPTCKATFDASPIRVDESKVEEDQCSQAAEPIKVTTNPSSSTQDSQDISLHFSELCQTEAISQDREALTCDKPKETGPKLEDAAKSLTLSPGKEAVGAKRSLTWEDFKATMTFSDDEFESEDFIPKQVNLNKAPTTGCRLSLKGNPNDMIDLDDMNSNQPRTPGVQGLIERFLKHSGTKKKPSTPQTVELSLISSEKDSAGDVLEIKHESLKIALTGNDSTNTDNPKPGARLKLLKDELHRQMRKQKEQEWQKKHEEMKNDQTYKGEKDECDMLPDDEEEEEELTESEAESEPEIDDVREPKKKRKPKSVFVDEEAEVEDDDGVESIDEKEESDNEHDNHGGDDGDDSDDIDEDEEELDEESIKLNENKESTSRGQLKRSGTAADLFSSQSTECTMYGHDDDDDDFLPAGQPNGVVQHETSMDKIDDGKDCGIVFSPMSLSIPGKNPSFMESNIEETPSKFSWARGVKSQDGLKRLFNEPDLTSTQEKMDELAALFSDKFQGSQNDIAKLANTGSTADSEADLIALCSGKFMTQLPHPEDLEEGCSPALSQSQKMAPSSKPALGDEDSQDFSLTWNDGVNQDKDCTNLSEDSKPKNKQFELEIMSSDDEQDFAQLQERKRKKHKKLDFSDDEDDEVANHQSDIDDRQEMVQENSNSNESMNDGGSKELFAVFQKPSKEVFYDSDENEIEPADFLEKEAELSEEEDWQGSEDEDEKGLDQLEMDEADKEDIDEDLVREQLVKNQMQKMLDEDRRDVRILQEMLLEDGELHSDSGGRERQFRWRNVDSSGMGDDGRGSDEEHADHEEEEDDAEWRKQRHEREMFLKEQREKQKKEEGNCGEEDEILENSELLKLGKAVLCKSRSNSQDLSCPKEPVAVKPPLSNQLLSPDGKRPNISLMKRGSFLSRGENVLAKLAKMTGSAKENVLVGAKNSGKFVFAAVSPPKRELIIEEGQESKTSKRKASLPVSKPQEKKPCLSTPSRQSSGLFDHL